VEGAEGTRQPRVKYMPVHVVEKLDRYRTSSVFPPDSMRFSYLPGRVLLELLEGGCVPRAAVGVEVAKKVRKAAKERLAELKKRRREMLAKLEKLRRKGRGQRTAVWLERLEDEIKDVEKVAGASKPPQLAKIAREVRKRLEKLLLRIARRERFAEFFGRAVRVGGRVVIIIDALALLFGSGAVLELMEVLPVEKFVSEGRVHVWW